RCHLRLCHRHPLHHRCSLQDKQPLSHGLRGRSRGRRCCRRLRLWCCRYIRCFPRLLRRPSLSAPTRQIKRRHRTVMIPLPPLTNITSSTTILHPKSRNDLDNLTFCSSPTSRPPRPLFASSARRYCFFLTH
ncbi:hypothetical protein D6D01_03033, partial [Aureobasidium pullulans]